MCIVFLQFAKRGHHLKSKYRLILAANRDEQFCRPSKAADFWEEAPNVIGGRDLTKGKEGGTWLGMTKQGKSGMLTNFRSEEGLGQPNAGLKPRGQILVNYFKGNPPPQAYVNELVNDKEYAPFNILLGDFTNDSGFRFFYGSNAIKDKEYELKPGFHGLCNAELNCSWTKVQEGKKMFAEIASSVVEKDVLIERLIQLMQNDEPNYPDHGGSSLHLTDDLVEPMSSIFINVPEIMYGTRTITIIIVDEENQVTFLEKTMTDPMNNYNPGWETRKFEFTIDAE